MVKDGKRNKEIASSLGIAENTVKVYLSRLFLKVNVSGRHKLGNYGREIDRMNEALNSIPKETPKIEVLMALASTLELTADEWRTVLGVMLSRSAGGKNAQV